MKSSGNFLNYRLSEDLLEKAKRNLDKSGYFLFDEITSEIFCNELVEEIDLLATETDVEINYGGSEHRIWLSHQKSNLIPLFKDFSDLLVSYCMNKEYESYDILAYRNLKIDETNYDLLNNRWHIDSLNKQLKVFLFLKDVDDGDGPLQWIPNTQKPLFKAIEVLKGNYLSPLDFLGKNRKYQNVPDDLINVHLKKDLFIQDCTVKKGTALLIDTSCLHRAKPCFGSRYTLCSYYSN